MFVEQEIVIHSWITGENGAIKNRVSSTAWIHNNVSDKRYDRMKKRFEIRR